MHNLTASASDEKYFKPCVAHAFKFLHQAITISPLGLNKLSKTCNICLKNCQRTKTLAIT